MVDTDKLNHPFGYYDFFGYLFPGALLGAYAYWFHAITEWHPPLVFQGEPHSLIAVVHSVERLIAIRTEQNAVSIGVVLGVLLTLFYVIGHLTAAFSSILFDRIIMLGVLRYPTEHLLGIERSGYTGRSEVRSRMSTASYKLTMAAVLIFLSTPLLRHYGEVERFYQLSFAAVCALIGTRVFTGFARESYHTTKRRHTIFSRSNRIWRAMIALLLWLREYCVCVPLELVALPIDAIVGVLFRILHLRRFSPEFVAKYGDRYRKEFDLDYTKAGTENHWLPLLLIYQRDHYYAAVVRHWVNLYGFARNAAGVSFAACFYANWWLWGHPHLKIVGSHSFVKVTLAAGLIFSIRYWQLFYSFYTKNVLRCFVLLPEENTESLVAAGISDVNSHDVHMAGSTGKS